MRILDVRVETPKEKSDIAKGRVVLQSEISHPAKTVMVIRGTTPEISFFADNADGRSTAFPWREVVWVKNTAIFDEGQEIMLFPKKFMNHCAVVLDLEDKPVAWLKEDSSLTDIEEAFLKAGGSH